MYFRFPFFSKINGRFLYQEAMRTKLFDVLLLFELGRQMEMEMDIEMEMEIKMEMERR